MHRHTICMRMYMYRLVYARAKAECTHARIKAATGQQKNVMPDF